MVTSDDRKCLKYEVNRGMSEELLASLGSLSQKCWVRGSLGSPARSEEMFGTNVIDLLCSPSLLT